MYNLKLNCLIFSTSLNSSLIIFVQTYTVNYRNALDRLRVRMNIILLTLNKKCQSLNMLTARNRSLPEIKKFDDEALIRDHNVIM